MVSEDGISVDQSKVEAVQRFPVPSQVRELRSFLGLASYYRRFIEGFSKIAGPLFALTKKDAEFKWKDTCQQAFDRLKDMVTSAPLLVFPDFSKRFILETDASGLGLGAILSQEQSDRLIAPIAYVSRTLQQHEANYGISELEALAVVWATKHFRVYLYGHPCDVYTDHEALQALLNTPHPSGKLARWGMALQELDLHLHYRPGKVNKNADALSRRPIQPQSIEITVEETECIVAAITDPQSTNKDGEGNATLAERQGIDVELNPIISYLKKGTLPDDEKAARELILNRKQYVLMDNILYHLAPDNTLRIIPPKEYREGIIREVHNGRLAGHLRDAKIYGQIGRTYWWPGMRKEVTQLCRACEKCASRHVGKPIKPPLTPIPVKGPFDRIGVDVIKFPRSARGNKYAVVFMDYLTKWPEVFATRDQTSLTIAELLVEKVISRHGVPAELLSDRGQAFLSRLMVDVYGLLGIRKANTTAYHPQTDGLVERFHRTLTDMLAKNVKRTGRDWDGHLPYVLFSYRTSIQTSTRESPFYLLYGRDPRLPGDAVLSTPEDRRTIDLRDYKTEMSQPFTEAWKLAQCQVQKAQKSQKEYYDRGTVTDKVHVGDRVFVYTPSEKKGKAYKFACPYVGPYRVLEVYDNGARLKHIRKPNSQPIRVALNRVRLCPAEIRDTSSEGSEKDKQTEVESDEEGASTTDGNVMELSESGDTNNSDPEKREDRVHTAQELETVDNSQGPESPQSSTHCRKKYKGKNTWSRRLRPRVKKRNH